MSQEAFTPQAGHGTGFAVTTLITSSATATFYPVDGTAVKLAVRSAACYFQWGRKSSTPITASGVVATQADWLPQDSVSRFSRPLDCDGIWILWDTGAAQVFLTVGVGI